MAEQREIDKLLQERDKLLEEVARRSQEMRALNMQTVEILNERVKMIEELQLRNSELGMLLAIAQSTAQLLEPEALLQIALDKVLEFLGLERGFAALLGEEEGKLGFICHRGFPPPMAQQLEQARSDQGLIGFVLRSGQPIIVENIGNGTTQVESQVTVEPGKQSVVVAVLKAREKVLGVLGVSSPLQRLFTNREKDLLFAIANQVGIALDNARLFQQVRQSAQRIGAISNITRSVCTSLKLSEVYEVFVQELKKLVDFDRFSIALVEGEEVRIPVVSSRLDSQMRAGAKRPLKGSALAWVMEHKKSNIESDLSQERLFTTDEVHLKGGLRSAIRVPLFHQGEVFGTLNCLSTRPNAYGEKEREILEGVAGEIASAVRNDILFEELARRLSELEEAYKRTEALSRITRSVCTSLNLSEVYEVFAQELKKLVDFDRCSIAVAEGEELRIPLVFSRLDAGLRVGSRLPMKGSALAWITEHKKSIIEEDFSQERPFASDERHLKDGLRSVIRVPLFDRGVVLGTLNLFSIRPNAFGEREREILEGVAGEIASAIRDDILFEKLTRRQGELEEAYRRIEEHAAALQESLREQQRAYLLVAQTLVHLLESRQPFMRGHSERVAHYARSLSRQMGLSPPDEKNLELAARLHDLGMLSMPESLWYKREGLSPAERAQLESHTTVLAEVLMSVPFLRDALPLVRAHHERYDGKGYPGGLQGENIPLGARIIAVADAYDALISERPYRPALSDEEALETLKKGAGTEWDPRVVEAFLQVHSSGSWKIPFRSRAEQSK